MERRRVPVVGLALAGAVLFCAGIVAVPWLEARGHRAASWARLAYTPLCHQRADRSLHLHGRPLVVCARCTGLYAGGVAGLALAIGLGWGARRRGPRPRWVLILAAPALLDVLANLLGLGGLGNGGRLAAALPAGFGLGVFLGIGLTDLGRMMRRDHADPEGPKRWTRASPTC